MLHTQDTHVVPVLRGDRVDGLPGRQDLHLDGLGIESDDLHLAARAVVAHTGPISVSTVLTRLPSRKFFPWRPSTWCLAQPGCPEPPQQPGAAVD